jgi:hypothetical protein
MFAVLGVFTGMVVCVGLALLTHDLGLSVGGGVVIGVVAWISAAVTAKHDSRDLGRKG